MVMVLSENVMSTTKRGNPLFYGGMNRFSCDGRVMLFRHELLTFHHVSSTENYLAMACEAFGTTVSSCCNIYVCTTVIQ